MGSLGDDYPFEFSWIDLQSKKPVPLETILKERDNLPEDKFNKKYRIKYEQLIGASRFITKLWNAYRFLYLNLNKIDIDNLNINSKELSPIDSYYFSEFNRKLEIVTDYFAEYNWHGAIMGLRSFFWNDICDNYIEAIKYKFYLEDQKIRRVSLKNALNLLYKLLNIFAIIMPYISEEIYSIIYKKFKNLTSIHQEKWPTPYDNLPEDLAEKGKIIIGLIKLLRMNKSQLQIPLNQEINKVILLTEKKMTQDIANFSEDIKNTIRIKNLELIKKSEEKSIKAKPDLEQDFEDLNIKIYFYK
jgi:valyl-tRNA synthetase